MAFFLRILLLVIKTRAEPEQSEKACKAEIPIKQVVDPTVAVGKQLKQAKQGQPIESCQRS